MTFGQCQRPKWLMNHYGKNFKESITHLFLLFNFPSLVQTCLGEISVLDKKDMLLPIFPEPVKAPVPSQNS